MSLPEKLYLVPLVVPEFNVKTSENNAEPSKTMPHSYRSSVPRSKSALRTSTIQAAPVAGYQARRAR
jgi:hypothetical protein